LLKATKLLQLAVRRLYVRIIKSVYNYISRAWEAWNFKS